MLASFLLISYLRTCFNREYVDPAVSCKNSCKNLDDYKTVYSNPNCFENPDIMLKVVTGVKFTAVAKFSAYFFQPAVIKRYNYSVETHEVQTPDGYILVLFRIPPKDGKIKKQSVFLQYGILFDSNVWLLLGHDSLAFVLADEGYDVWLGNLRESVYSRQHVFLRESDNQYWEYSWDELASNDIKSSLEEVYRISGPVIYIGHSKGAALGLMFASEYPEEARKLLRGIIAICPAVYFDVNFKISTMMKGFTKSPVPVLFRSLTTNFLVFSYCLKHPRSCIKIMEGFFGENLPENFLRTFKGAPSAVSKKEMSHIVQLVKSKKFQKFDYGPEENSKKYGQKLPPTYNLSAVDIPVYIFYGKRDRYISEENAGKLLDELGSKRKSLSIIPVNDTGYQFTHLDFIRSEFARKFFYDPLVDILKKELSSESN